jgi:hypothetical protein
MLAPPQADALAAALLAVVQTGRPGSELCDRLRKTALAAVQERTWESSLRQLAAGYRSALLRTAAPGQVRAA